LDVADSAAFISERLEPFLANLPRQFSNGGEPLAGIGEIGLDRLKCREVSPLMREVFERQLKAAADLKCPVILHGAKCWGQVVSACQIYKGIIPRFLFHGFSRSDGLIPDIVELNGFISVGAAVLNDHATNYRKLVAKIPLDRLLLETDCTESTAADFPRLGAIADEVAHLRGMPTAALLEATESNASIWLR
jgi:TatD DNase family protein